MSIRQHNLALCWDGRSDAAMFDTFSMFRHVHSNGSYFDLFSTTSFILRLCWNSCYCADFHWRHARNRDWRGGEEDRRGIRSGEYSSNVLWVVYESSKQYWTTHQLWGGYLLFCLHTKSKMNPQNKQCMDNFIFPRCTNINQLPRPFGHFLNVFEICLPTNSSSRCQEFYS